MTFRSETYRRYIASLPCAHCGLEGYSQAAHVGGLAEGKGGGLKVSDARCIPLCGDRPEVAGCHTKFDRHERPFERLGTANEWGERVAKEIIFQALESGVLVVKLKSLSSWVVK